MQIATLVGQVSFTTWNIVKDVGDVEIMKQPLLLRQLLTSGCVNKCLFYKYIPIFCVIFAWTARFCSWSLVSRFVVFGCLGFCWCLFGCWVFFVCGFCGLCGRAGLCLFVCWGWLWFFSVVVFVIMFCLSLQFIRACSELQQEFHILEISPSWKRIPTYHR